MNAGEMMHASRSVLADLLERPKFEMIPLKGAADEASLLPPGSTITVTASPAKGMSATVELAVELAAAGYHVVPHLSARLTRDHAELVEIMARLTDAGITDAFVVGGDAKEPGEYFDGLALLEAMTRIGHPFDRIGLPGYPEGHPTIPDDALRRALDDKGPYASWVTTQMCFSDDAIREWVDGERLRGTSLPLYIGIPGVAEVRKLVGIAARIGVGDSHPVPHQEHIPHRASGASGRVRTRRAAGVAVGSLHQSGGRYRRSPHLHVQPDQDH